MKVFTSTNFPGHYPVGVAAVIVAETEADALQCLWEALPKGLKGKWRDNVTVEEVDTSEEGTTILNDGDY